MDEDEVEGVDVSGAGKMAAEQMDAIEKDYEGRAAEIGMMISIVQIIGEDGQIENRVIHNAPAPFLALGLMRVAEEIILQRD